MERAVWQAKGVPAALEVSGPGVCPRQEPARPTPAAGLRPSLCPPQGQERSKELLGWEKREWRKLTEMGGAHGGADQEPNFLLSTQASSPQLTPTPSSPHSPAGTQGSGPPSKFQPPLPQQRLSPSPPVQGWRLKDPGKRRMVGSRVPRTMIRAGPL